MILKLFLRIICLILLVHPVISGIDNQWATKVFDITKKLIEVAEVFEAEDSEMIFRTASPKGSKSPPKSKAGKI